jgi:hypothetical protein
MTIMTSESESHGLLRTIKSEIPVEFLSTTSLGEANGKSLSVVELRDFK